MHAVTASTDPWRERLSQALDAYAATGGPPRDASLVHAFTGLRPELQRLIVGELRRQGARFVNLTEPGELREFFLDFSTSLQVAVLRALLRSQWR